MQVATFFGAAIVFYITGWLIVRVIGRGIYYTSVTDEFAKIQILGDLTKREDGRTLVRSGLVFFVGMLPWLFVFLLCVAAYWTGIFDFITPLRLWLFGPSMQLL